MKQKIFKTVITIYHFAPKHVEASDLCKEAEVGCSAYIANQDVIEVKSLKDVPQEVCEFLDLPENEVA